MFVYKISAFGYEEYDPVELLHTKKFSRQQLVDMYISCMEEAYCRYYDHLKGIDLWDDPSEDDESISMLHRDIVEILIKKHEFKKVTYEAELGIWTHISTDPNERACDDGRRSAAWDKIKNALITTSQKCKAQIVADIKMHRIKNGREV